MVRTGYAVLPSAGYRVLVFTTDLMTTPDTPATAVDWRTHLIDDYARIERLLRRTHRIAVLGIKTEETRPPAYYVPEYAQRAGYAIVPRPGYYSHRPEIFRQP